MNILGRVVAGLGLAVAIALPAFVHAADGTETATLLVGPSAAIRKDKLPQAVLIKIAGFTPNTKYEYTFMVYVGTNEKGQDYGSFWHPSTGRFGISYEQFGPTDENGTFLLPAIFLPGSAPAGTAQFRFSVRPVGSNDPTRFLIGSLTIFDVPFGTFEGTVFGDAGHTQPLENTFIVADTLVNGAPYQFVVLSEVNNIAEENPDIIGFTRFHAPPSTIEALRAYSKTGAAVPLYTQIPPPWAVQEGVVTIFDIPPPPPPRPTLWISEFLPDPAAPLTDTADEWFELYNPGSAPTTTEGVSVRDQRGAISTKPLPPRSIPPGGFSVFTRRDVSIAQNNDGDGLELLFGTDLLDSTPVTDKAREGQSFARTINGGWEWTTTPTSGNVNVITGEQAPLVTAVTPSSSNLTATVLVGLDVIGGKTIVLQLADGAVKEARFLDTPPAIREGDQIEIPAEGYHYTPSGRISIERGAIIRILQTGSPPTVQQFRPDAPAYIPLQAEGTIERDERGLTFGGVPLQRESTFGLKEGQHAVMEGFLRPYRGELVFVLTAVEKEKKAKKSAPKNAYVAYAAEKQTGGTITAVAAAIGPTVYTLSETSAPRAPPRPLLPFLIFGMLGALGVYVLWPKQSR